jgi:hypothetical protein
MEVCKKELSEILYCHQGQSFHYAVVNAISENSRNINSSYPEMMGEDSFQMFPMH